MRILLAAGENGRKQRTTSVYTISEYTFISHIHTPSSLFHINTLGNYLPHKKNL